VILGLALFFYLFYAPTQESLLDRTTETSSEKDNLERELVVCEKQFTESGKQACVEFVKESCPTLKANYGFQEKRSVRSQDLGYRLPVLQQHHDPFYPIECFRQWLLTEADFAYPSLFPAHSHASQHHTEMSADYPKPFSAFPDFSEYAPGYFAHQDDQRNLQFPGKYEIEKKYSVHDQKQLKRVLQAAYQYADINSAIRDGYVPVPGFILSMGIHFMNPSLFDETVAMDKPEFLIYLKSRYNNAYVLAQLGYIQVQNNRFKKFRYPLFETPEAQGHSHLLNISYIDEKGWWKYAISTNDEPTEDKMLVFLGPLDKYVHLDPKIALLMYDDMKAEWAKSPYRLIVSDSLWMLHVAINLYNEDGLFADTFPLLDTMAKSGQIYSFFGRKFDLNDYE
jgi:hypothetical protein